MKVRITKDCISNGKKGDKECCPIGLALKKRGYVEVTVDKTAVALTSESGLVRVVPLPTEAQAFIEAFDDDGDVEPFTFDLRL